MPAIEPAIPNLWPHDIRLEVLPPVVILKKQAESFPAITKGILSAEVTTVTGDRTFVTHRLDIVAVQLDQSRHRVLSATHREQFYPVVVEAETFRPKPKKVPLMQAYGSAIAAVAGISSAVASMEVSTEPDRWPNPDDWRPVASSQQKFVEQVGKVLQSSEVRAVIDSLLARSYERLLADVSGHPAGRVESHE